MIGMKNGGIMSEGEGNDVLREEEVDIILNGLEMTKGGIVGAEVLEG